MKKPLPFYTQAYLRSRAVAIEGDCLIWQGAKTTNGYGYVGPNQMGTRTVHVLMWMHTHGERPPGTEFDHLCRNRDCINPEHLEAVSHAENVRRGTARCAKLTECKRGHPFVEGSYYFYDGKRRCKVCQSERHRAYRERRAERWSLSTTDRGDN